MFLKSLSLKGFKSFADPTTMVLEPGVTVVVGPNGSGKSNVVDAMAWVLGAQAPKAVRSQKMDDVIFAGTASRPALGRAEVAITIDNSDGTLGVDFNEITITRILFRTGESEYLINGVPCRLLDVQELLSDAGVGRQQHVIVSQGQIDAVLNARPEDRRAIVEEAAGVLKFRKRKEKAERRLDATEANLLRVQDLLREVRRQLKPLERQAKAAERHEALVSELATLKAYVAGREIAGLRTKLESVAATRLEIGTDEKRLMSSLASLDTEVVAAEAELSAHGASDVSDRLRRVEQLHERGRGLAAVLTERRRSLERDRGHLLDADVVATLEADAARFREELDAVAVELAQIEPAAAALLDEESSFSSERAEALDGGDAENPTRAASAAAEVRGELRSVRAERDRAAADLARAEARRDSLTDRAGHVDDEVTRFRADCATAADAEAPLYEQVAAAESARADAERVVGTAEERLRATEGSSSSAAARVEALQMALDAARERAGAERLSELDGVLGTLLDLIEIDAGWEAAVAAALGESLTAVVVDGPSNARTALETLSSADTSGAVLALGATPAAASAPAGGEPIRPHVRGRRADVDDVLDVVLAGAVSAGTVDAAIDLALAHPTAVIVTPAGDRFGVNGWRVGVAGSGVTAAALDEATSLAERCDAERAEARHQLDDARSALVTAVASERDLNRRLDVNDASLTAASEGLARAQSERREIQAELQSLAAAIDELRSTSDRAVAREAELAALLPSLESDEAAEVEAARAWADLRGRFEERAAALAARRRELDVGRAALEERQQLLERRLDETERRLEADAAARIAAADQREAVERSLAVIDALVERVEANRTVVEAHHGELSEQRRRQSDEVRELSERLEQLRSQRADDERSVNELRERSHKADLDEAEAKLRLETAIETLRRDLDIEPELAEAAEMPEVPDGATPAGRVRELERELRLLGPINPLALEEFNELQQRHAFLEEQLDDVRSTRRELSRVIAAVDHEIQNVFAAAFADVSENFAELFGLLFPGGTGRLKLTHPDDLLNTGIEVEAKPSGKNVKKLSLLSGGERSLTALAYLFAVFRSRPSPFYVMDEVEAALDDVNLHRFLGLVEEFRKDAQLIIVSHQKRTMEAGDSLLGVSMQPGGSSKVVVERAAEAVARAGAPV